MPSETTGRAVISPAEMRIVVLPPTHADGVAIEKLLVQAGTAVKVAPDIPGVCKAITSGAGALILSEEAVLADSNELLDCLAMQPVWSDLPVVILSRSGRESSVLEKILPQLGSVTVVERPMRTSTLLSLARSSLRARERQYLLRTFLSEREQLLESERSARAEAERAGRMKDEFLATLSHELRTPLNAVLGWSKLLRKGKGLTDEVANGLTIIERNARSQAQIIGDLLDMSRIISGKVRLELTSVDLEAAIEATIESVKPSAEAKQIAVSYSRRPGPRPAMINADPDRLQQVLWNLLSNAVKFTPHGGQVQVSLALKGGNFEVAVTDNGEGIPAEVLPHIFDRFRQADASSARRHGGLGLGLSIVRQLTELHGGTITAHSKGAGTGSTFRIRLPANKGPSRVAGLLDFTFLPRVLAAVIDDPTQVDLQGVKVLVVDDEPDARALVERLLCDCHASVVTAASADEALQVLVQESPQVLVSDIGMPGTDGYALARRIRALDSAAASIPAIALTAYVRSEDRAMALEAGFQCHLTKPVEAVELVRLVQRLARAPEPQTAAPRPQAL
jgi:signal transduction histidine kinase/ActR/RegA family two-component response regulator